MSRPSDSPRGASGAVPYVVAASEPIALRRVLRGRHVDTPAAGPVDGDLLIGGWALADDAPLERAVATGDGRRLANVRIDRPRRDLADVFPDLDHASNSGFRLRIPATVARNVAELVIGVTGTMDAEPIPIWRIKLAPAEPPRQVSEPQRRRRAWRPGRRQTAAESVPLAGPSLPEPVPPTLEETFHVVALMSTFNEADIIGPVLDHLATNGISTYLIDNDSTDDTVVVAEQWLGRGLLGVERLPHPREGSTAWRAILERKLELASELGADWYIHHDADEIRETPWPGVALRDGIAWVDRLGYSVIDFRVLNFAPVDDAFRAGDDPRTHFALWEEPAEYDRVQRKCWKAGAPDVALEDGGHDVRFTGRQVFPLRFLLRHYPIRGQAHGTRKVLHDRADRFVGEEIAMGWHRQYDHVQGPDHLFLKNPAALRAFEPDRIRLETMLEDARNTPRGDDAAAVTGGAPESARGFLEIVSPTAISGWALGGDEHSDPVTVQLWDGSRVVAEAVASQPRPDVEAQGIGDGRGGFTLRTPRELLDGRPHWIWATVAGTRVALRRSPLVLHAGGRASVTTEVVETDTAGVA